MALITRLTRLFQADFHAVLDSIEEPDIQLKQAIREMEFELQQEQQALALLEHESQQLTNLHADLESKLTGFDEELDICFNAGKEDLARDLIRRKLETEAACTGAGKKFSRVKEDIERLQKRIVEHQQQLDNMKQKLELLLDENQPGKAPYSAAPAGVQVRTEDIEIAFLREKQRRAKS